MIETMDRVTHKAAAVRRQILKESLPRVSIEQAVALVGILYERRFVLAIEIVNPTRNTKERRQLTLPALEPQQAAIVVGDVFRIDCDVLFREFQNRWATLKDTPIVKSLLASIRAHRLVEDLERCSDVI